jgi:DNA modification methylase
MDTNIIYNGDCLNVLRKYIPDSSIDLIYLDPPFSFDPSYARLWPQERSVNENFEEIRKGGVKHYILWLSKRLDELLKVLKDTGSIYLHCNHVFGHYIKVAMDDIFGRKNFQNELIWYHRGGSVPKKRFARKHATIFFYTKSTSGNHTFNVDAVRQEYSEDSQERLKYPARAFRGDKVYDNYKPNPLGKHPDDVLMIQPVMPSAKRRTGWNTQKPDKLLEVIVSASSNPGDIVLDPMCGCGTTLVVAHKLGRKWIGVDISSEACKEMAKSLHDYAGVSDVEIQNLPLSIKDLKKMGYFEFQDYVCEMIGAQKSNKKTKDMGIDGIYQSEVPVQVKQREKVGRPDIDAFQTAVRRKKKEKGCVVAFSYTRDAYEEVARVKAEEGLDIYLIEIADLMQKDYGIEALISE